jgi:hypothetical protein
MIKSHITSGDGNEQDAYVKDHALVVTQYSCPPLLPQKNRVFSRKFTDDGLANGTSEMGVDGSTTPVEYYIPADDDNDVYITRLSFILGYGTSAWGYEFADSGAALTNGLKISYTDTTGYEVTIMNPKANYSFMRASGLQVSIADWEARGFAAAGDYGLFSNISLLDMVPPLGIKLDRGTKQKISILVRDDCTDADLFNCSAFGFERFE